MLAAIPFTVKAAARASAEPDMPRAGRRREDEHPPRLRPFSRHRPNLHPRWIHGPSTVRTSSRTSTDPRSCERTL